MRNKSSVKFCVGTRTFCVCARAQFNVWCTLVVWSELQAFRCVGLQAARRWDCCLVKQRWCNVSKIGFGLSVWVPFMLGLLLLTRQIWHISKPFRYFFLLFHTGCIGLYEKLLRWREKYSRDFDWFKRFLLLNKKNVFRLANGGGPR